MCMLRWKYLGWGRELFFFFLNKSVMRRNSIRASVPRIYEVTRSSEAS